MLYRFGYEGPRRRRQKALRSDRVWKPAQNVLPSALSRFATVRRGRSSWPALGAGLLRMVRALSISIAPLRRCPEADLLDFDDTFDAVVAFHQSD